MRRSSRSNSALRLAPGSVRIIGGRWRGSRLDVAKNTPGLRPTSDRVRETLYNWLQPAVAGARCLDLFAGSGVLGFEALSRGAAEVCFVERERHLVQGLDAQLQRFAATDQGRVIHGLATDFLSARRDGQFDLVFLDPPFAEPVAPLLQRVKGLLAAGARVYVERAADTGLPDASGGEWIKQGKAASVVFGLWASKCGGPLTPGC